MKNGALFFWVAVLVLVVAGLGSSVFVNVGPGNLGPFTQCLTDKGIKMYGAFWCPHCQATKRMFGKSAHLLPYIECSTADGRGQTQECKDKGVQSYPTWTTPASTTTLTGEQTLQQLSYFSGCPLPPTAQ